MQMTCQRFPHAIGGRALKSIIFHPNTKRSSYVFGWVGSYIFIVMVLSFFLHMMNRS
jgi:hypothetical protein